MTDFSEMPTTERTLARARSVPTTRARLLKKSSYNVHCKKKKCDYRPPVPRPDRPVGRILSQAKFNVNQLKPSDFASEMQASGLSRKPPKPERESPRASLKQAKLIEVFDLEELLEPEPCYDAAHSITAGR